MLMDGALAIQTKGDSKMIKILKVTFLAGAISLLSTGAHAQDDIYRCGGEYTNSVSEAQAKNCILISPTPSSGKPNKDYSEFLDAPAASSAKPTKVMLAKVAQEMEGTIFVTPLRDSVDGELFSCGLEFSALKRDFITMKGAPVTIYGSFNLRYHPGTGIVYVLKLGGFDGFGTENSFNIASAFIRAPNGVTPKKAIRADAETNGFGLFGGPFDKDALAAFSGISEKSQWIVGFNRKPGQQDVIVKLDLNVIDTQMDGNGKVIRQKSKEPVNEFVTCSYDLLKAARASLK